MLEFSISDVAQAWRKAIADDEKRVNRAALAAVTAAGNQAKAAGRASIAANGFSIRWQNALRLRIYEDKPAAFLWHKIDYATVFENGATIAGKPYLWIALPIVPAAFGRGRNGKALTPAEFIERFGPLVAVNVPGKAPMLFAQYHRVGHRKGKAGKADLAGLTGVPLYVGVPQVEIVKKFDIAGAVRRAAEALPALYENALSADDRDS